MKSYLSIIRLPNLIIMAMSMFLIRYALLEPILNYNDLTLEQPPGLFILLIMSIILLAAGGNVINDLKDVATDKINKPDINVIGVSISEKLGYKYYYVLTSLGLLLGFFVSYYSGFLMLFVIHIFIGLSLWMYSNKLNNIPLVGNALVSALLASLPWIVLLFDLPLIILAQDNSSSGFHLPGKESLNFTTYFSIFVFLVLAYSLFAYLQNMARELTKDIIDVEGDSIVGYRTGPTVFGLNNSKNLIRYSFLFLAFVYVGFILLLFKYFIPVSPTILSFALLLLLILLLFIPLIISFRLLSRADQKQDFVRLSRWNKISQVIGLLTTIYFLFFINASPKKTLF